MQPASRAIRLLDLSKPLSEAMCCVILEPDAVGSPAQGGRAHGRAHSRAHGPIDLSRTMVLVPGGRLAHAVEHRLLAHAREMGRALFAPTIVTPLMLAARLAAPSKRVLSPIASRLAWREVLESSRVAGDGFGARVAAVFGGSGEPDQRAILRLAQRMQRLSTEIAASMRTIGGVARSEPVARRPEVARKLAVLAEFAERHDALLARMGAEDRDDALRDAVTRDDIVAEGIDRVVVLLADPEVVQRQLLGHLASRGVCVEICVHTRESIDADGFPIAREWEKRAFDVGLLPTDAIRVGDGPAECAQAAIAAIREITRSDGSAGSEGRPGAIALRSDEVALVAPDAETRRELERVLTLVGSPAAAAEGRTFAATRTGSLLERLAELVREHSAAGLAAFVRHDDADTWLRTVAGVTGAESAVTRYRAATLVGSWRDEVVVPPDAFARDVAERFGRVRDAVLRLVQPLDAARVASAWARPLREVVQAIVGEDARGAFAGERLGSIRALDRALAELAEVPAECSATLACHEVIGLLLDELGRREIRGEAHADGVSVLGWLDAGMADERVLLLTGFAEGSVPQRAPVDPVLPDDVRAELGLPSGRRFAARDAWILDGILARARARRADGAPGRVVFIVPRRTAEGDPQKPSRFLLRVADEALPGRVTHLFGAEPAPAVVDGASDAGAADFRVTPPVPGARIEAVRVTAFKTFIECPYLFQLQIDPRLRLRTVDEHAVELDAMGFGNLVHSALEGWGREEAGRTRRTEDPSVIEQDVCAQLDRHVREFFPNSRAAALRVQVEVARARLRRFAVLQAEQAKQGWRIHSVECSFARDPADGELPAPRFMARAEAGAAADSAAESVAGSGGAPSLGVYLTGRIDRVDVLDGVGRFRAVDYKTSSSGDTPTDTHMRITGGKKARQVEWLDLQLPLYRVLLRSLSPAMHVAPGDLGYINLAPSADKSGFRFLEASEHDLEQAEECARAIVARICAGDFAPAARPPVRPEDPLAVIWGLGMRSVVAGGDAEPAAARVGAAQTHGPLGGGA